MTATPFAIPVQEDEAAWIRRRVDDYRFFEEPQNAGWRYGASRDYMERLRDYWLNDYDWPAAVGHLNRLSHARIDMGAFGGRDDFHLHAVHLKSSRADARPLLIAHGWPGSIVEFDAIFERLAEPEDAGAPAFHVVAPSLPGYAWSDKPASPVGPKAVAGLYDGLMQALGYDDYIYQGGDWGSVIGGWIGLEADHCAAVHLNGYGLRAHDMRPHTDEDRKWFEWAQRIRSQETAYLQLQGTKNQSLAYAMMDSPMGVAAWLAEKFQGWSDVTDGDEKFDPPFTMNQLLTNVMIYLTTRSFNTATWLYRGMFEEGGFAMPEGVRVEKPTGIAAFPHDLLAFPPRSMVERGYNVVHWTDMPAGGHFASMEKPDLFLADLRKFIATL